MMVGLNEQGLVHDFYYPYVGLDNLTNARSAHHKVGVWVDGEFHWIDDGTWEVSIDFEDAALISTIKLKHSKLELEILFKDFVDSSVNAFCRDITVHNTADKARDVRVFMHQVFQISRAGRADTALFVPDEPYVLDYKGNCSLLIYGQHEGGKPFDQYAIGIYGIESKEGTFRDAEDGELSGNPVEHGGVDSVIRFSLPLKPKSSQHIYYWIVAADSQYAAQKYHDEIQKDGLPARLDKTRIYWNEWIKQGDAKLTKLDSRYRSLVQKSMMVIKAHTDKRGGILASGDSSIYNYGRDYYSYVWPRDAALALWPLLRMGYKDEARRFFEFCRDVLHPDGYLQHKFQPDRAIGSTWHPLVHNNRKELAIQEDETAVVLFMLGEYYDYIGDHEFVQDLYRSFIKPAADFMAEFIDEKTGLPHASYDLWEEKFLTNTYTVAMTYSALSTATHFAEIFQFPDDIVRWRDAAEKIKANSHKLYRPEMKAYCKGFWLDNEDTFHYDDTIDASSVYGAFMFGEGCFDDQSVAEAMATTKSRLFNQSNSGGMIRYENDNYFLKSDSYKGNPWFVCSFWLAQYAIQDHDPQLAESIMQWAAKRTLASGVMAEQLDPETSEAVGVAPLVWSHAELINTVLDIAQGVAPNRTT
jgi:GH15 family glucan-1,4-alpha-glucosidase